ncbi:hypothetical protein HDU87_006345 [Geranomyces variabilis]|uniref:chitin synthase n=1 Tax=Geranomyces variabilis TaxID=109894 RepID=A0AAD5XL51_9FUNG|nr:hypothetical protein HDU87_006345 [Geranomyces variabilis]
MTARQTDVDEKALMAGTPSDVHSMASTPPEYPENGRIDNPRSSSTFSFSRPSDGGHENLHVNGRPPTGAAPPINNYNNYGGPHNAFGGAAGRFPDPEAPIGPLSRHRSSAGQAGGGPPPARVGATSAAATATSLRAQEIKPEPVLDSDASAIWTWSARILTCCFLPFCLRACGQKDRAVQQAWREKLALCMIIVLMCGAVAFLTVGLRRVLCPDSGFQETIPMFTTGTSEFLPAAPNAIVVDGLQYDFNRVQSSLLARGFTLNDDRRGTDISKLFVDRANCAPFYPAGTKCDFPELAGISPTSECASLSFLNGIPKSERYLDWSDLSRPATSPHRLTVYNGAVLNLTEYLAGDQSGSNPGVTAIISSSIGYDGTQRFVRDATIQHAIGCLGQGYRVGFVGQERNGCIAATVIENIALVVILGVVMAKFFMAVWFHWFGLPSSKVDPTPRQDKRLSRVSARYSVNVNNRHSVLGYNLPQTSDLYTIMLVTCYSEGKEGIRSTLDSLAGTDYPDRKKLLFVVADGLITGHGEEMSTPDIIVGMMELDPAASEPEPKSYIAIAHGEKQHNMAKVYSGWYVIDGRRVPMITVVKCGTPFEATQPKPGNRGKRDSQMVIMNFLSRTLFNDRMTALDHELFSRIRAVATTADKYEAILMVDADTKVAPDSLRHMVNAMRSDVTIMGLCGETRIANKTASFTSAIQVFEYYISHHLGKAFESVFGGVTCLPGCFCMYRIKAPKGDSGLTVPVLTNPNIVEEYSENVVDTLHKKNLLLLGEDRFLTTLMIRNFPHRKMVFVPSAVCWTIVPDQFKVLLSQRRRWINSTVHNLLELVLVRDLCGTFCFSMQFVVMLELIGTVVLPAAICLTLYLCISAILYHNAELIPFLMLAAILGLPGFLIAITTRKLVYVGWMIVYLVSLPIWNFVLPVYAFWHFDDFTWGETRKVDGEGKEEAHGKEQGRFESRAVAMKKWAEWERDRLGANYVKDGGDPKRRDYAKRQSARKSMLIPFNISGATGVGPVAAADVAARRTSIAIAPAHPASNEYWPLPTPIAAASPSAQRDSYYPPLLMGGLPPAQPQQEYFAQHQPQPPPRQPYARPEVVPSPGGIFEQGPGRGREVNASQSSIYEMRSRGNNSSDSSTTWVSHGSGESRRSSSSKGKGRR